MANLLLQNLSCLKDSFTNSFNDLKNTIEKLAVEQQGDIVYAASNFIDSVIFDDITIQELLLDISPIDAYIYAIPDFNSVAKRTLINFVRKYVYNLTPKFVANSSDFETEFPKQNNGLAGLDFSTIEDKNKCVWNEESWYNFHRQYFIKNPNNRYFIERQKQLQGAKFNSYFPNLEYSHKLLYFTKDGQKRRIYDPKPNKKNEIVEILINDNIIWEVFYKRDRNAKDIFLYQEIFGYDEKVALFKKWAKIIAERNFYVLDETLSAYNTTNNKKATKTTSFQIFRSGIGENATYLSTDTTLGAFEVCDYKGKHQGEYLFNGNYNKNSKDEDGGHDIVFP
jgi:hypothetical protein